MSEKEEPENESKVLMEVEIHETPLRYLTIEVSPLVAEKICEWTMKYNPSAMEEKRAVRAVKGARVVKEDVRRDECEIGCVEILSRPTSAH